MEQYSILMMFGGIVLITLAGSFFAPRFPAPEKRRPGALPGRAIEGRRVSSRTR